MGVGTHRVFRCVRISIRGLVGLSVGNDFIDENGLLRILNGLDSAGRGGRRDEEEGGTGRKEGRGE